MRVVLECGGLTPLSFCVSFAFCAIAVGGAERKKGTAKAASSHRTPKKANRPVGTKIVTFPEYNTGRKQYKLNTPGQSFKFHFCGEKHRLLPPVPPAVKNEI
jgi:hypothetical protein